VEGIDEDYQPVSTIIADYCWGNFESSQDQRERMYKVMEDLSRRHPGETVMLVSHGGPVTHLYQQLTEKDWWVHGEAAYASFSLYSRDEKRNSWKPHIINESSYLQEH
jgi:broad specificity phosphatase PhoE